MAVVIRMARHGQKKRPFYRLVATEKEFRRDGRFHEIIGTYNPMSDPPEVNLKEDRVRYWIGNGAQPSQMVRSLVNKKIPGLIEEREKAQREKIIARRKQRKARQAAAAG